MKEKALLIMVATFSIGTVVALLMRILPVDQFTPIAVMVIGYGVQQLQLSSTNKSWGGWTEDAAKKDEARYAATVTMFEQAMAQTMEMFNRMLAQFQGTIDKTANKAATAAVEKGAE